MKTAFVIFDGMTPMDFVGCYDALVRLKTMGFRDDFQWDICASTAQVTDHTGLIVVDAPVVDEGRIITARGVTSSLFLGIHLVTRIAGHDIAEKIAKQMDAEFALPPR
jgi:transcriptional regulator GlxA family with amidase domain